MAETCGEMCSVENIGTSFEGRDLKLMKVKRNIHITHLEGNHLQIDFIF